LDLRLTPVYVSSSDELELALHEMAEQRTEALLVASDIYLWSLGKRIADWAMTKGILSVFAFTDMVEAGGLMSFGTDTLQSTRQMASYIDRINRKTADALGLTIPHELWMRATRVIE
jgi:ABC-type uncharacterized transport system substrate-binding protein